MRRTFLGAFEAQWSCAVGARKSADGELRYVLKTTVPPPIMRGDARAIATAAVARASVVILRSVVEKRSPNRVRALSRNVTPARPRDSRRGGVTGTLPSCKL